MLFAANPFSAACIMNTRWSLLAPDPFFCGRQARASSAIEDSRSLNRFAAMRHPLEGRIKSEVESLILRSVVTWTKPFKARDVRRR
jgi:hypothetical protein